MPKKSLGMQDFSKIGKGEDVASIGKLPFEGRTHELIVSNALQEVSKLSLTWAFENDAERFQKKSLTLIGTLIDHKGKGSLYSLLADRNYVQAIERDEAFCMKTAFRLFMVDIELTETGLLCYREVIALVFEYFRKVKEEWLADG